MFFGGKFKTQYLFSFVISKLLSCYFMLSCPPVFPGVIHSGLRNGQYDSLPKVLGSHKHSISSQSVFAIVLTFECSFFGQWELTSIAHGIGAVKKYGRTLTLLNGQ